MADNSNVVPMCAPRFDLGQLVKDIKIVVYQRSYSMSVTEAIGALEIAKLEILQEQQSDGRR